MVQHKFILIISFLLYISVSICLLGCQQKSDPHVVSHEINTKKQIIQMHWKDKNEEGYENFNHLKDALAKEGKNLIFAMNGGMFNKDQSPTGLYIENGEILSKLDTQTQGYGNFYIQPNGIFYLTKDKKAKICKTTDFRPSTDILFATQSGPMLLINGKIHKALTKGSKNIHIRNGVGLLPNGNLVFGISKQKINFYDFASFFKDLGCQNALYLDGFVSKMYLPAKNWTDLGGEFGVIIAEHED
ncbi:MAG: hypothetical protein GY810_30725 [Aureispira sp.]|nr:hypothetical protein [Aureispira sp.]